MQCSVVETTPGASPSDPFCPPKGFNGSDNDYYLLCRSRFDSDLMAKTRMLAVASYAARPEAEVVTPFSAKGPFSKQVFNILHKLSTPGQVVDSVPELT